MAAELHPARVEQASGGVALAMAGRWRGEGGQHQGARRYQEDSGALKRLADGALLAVVADGMGGHAGGAVASKLAVDAFVKAIEDGGLLSEALQAANRAVRAGAAGKPQLTGMGATLVAALLLGDQVRWISVGDSPFFLVSAAGIEQLNADHSLAPQIDALAERGLITAEEAARHPGRHTLREAVMGEPLTLIDEGVRQVASDACLLVCSDGIQTLDDAGIAAHAGKPVGGLIAAVLAERSAHQDNVTVIKLEREP